MPASARPGKRLTRRRPNWPVSEGLPIALQELTDSELELLHLVADEPFLSLKQVADRLGVKPKTVANCKTLIAAKVGIYGHQAVNEYAVSVRDWLEKIGA